MPITYDINTDFLYNRGIEKGIEKERHDRNFEFVKNLLQDGDFSDERIASLAGVDIAFVHEVKKVLAHKK